MLILDEPTSGVDPVARDRFWELLIDLSRNRGVTIFVSTHFMNEAQRCDRISLMHAGRVLAQGTPAAIIRARWRRRTSKRPSSRYLRGRRAATAAAPDQRTPRDDSVRPAPNRAQRRSRRLQRFGPACSGPMRGARAMEIRRDPIRLAFALLGPILLMIVFGYGISFDVENLSYAVLDRRPHAREPRLPGELFAGSRYFREQAAPAATRAELERRLRSGRLKFAIEIPPGFGQDLKRGRRPRSASGSTAPCRSAPRRAAATSKACIRPTSQELARHDARPQAPRRPRPSRSASATTRTSRASTRWCRASS